MISTPAVNGRGSYLIELPNGAQLEVWQHSNSISLGVEYPDLGFIRRASTVIPTDLIRELAGLLTELADEIEGKPPCG